jgi:hypothetical protein
MSGIYTVVRKASEQSVVSLTHTTPAPPRHESDGDSILVAVHRDTPLQAIEPVRPLTKAKRG